MSTVRESIEVAVPASVAYDQLSHLENYPRFMSGVTDAAPLSATTAHMVMDLGGNVAEFDACITESRPGKFLCWEAMDGPQLSETMRLEQISPSSTRVIAELQVDAKELMPSETHAQEVLSRRLKADLDGFKRFVEASTSATPSPTLSTAPTLSSGLGINERPVHRAPRSGNLGPLSNL